MELEVDSDTTVIEDIGETMGRDLPKLLPLLMLPLMLGTDTMVLDHREWITETLDTVYTTATANTADMVCLFVCLFILLLS